MMKSASGNGKNGHKLTAKQQLFVGFYLGPAKGNATEAARLAGYGGNDVTLASVGAENLRKPQIAELIGEKLKTAVMSADRVLEELGKIAEQDWRECLVFSQSEGGDEDEQGVQVQATLSLRDKLRALELLGKYHKLFTDRHEHTGADGAPIVIRTITVHENGAGPLRGLQRQS